MKAPNLIYGLETPLADVRQAFVGTWSGGFGPWGWWHGPFLGWGAGWPGMIMTYGFWGLVIAMLVLLIRRLVHTGKAGSALIEKYPAIEILKQRYAKGEITQVEFRRN
jgi:uncharacterized membrane protein